MPVASLSVKLPNRSFIEIHNLPQQASRTYWFSILGLVTFFRSRKRKAVPLEEEGWDSMRTISSILEPINDATRAMCAKKVPTISLMMPFFDSVLDALNDSKDRFLLHLK